MAHNDGKVPATSGFLPTKLKSYTAVETKEKGLVCRKGQKTGLNLLMKFAFIKFSFKFFIRKVTKLF